MLWPIVLQNIMNLKSLIFIENKFRKLSHEIKWLFLVSKLILTRVCGLVLNYRPDAFNGMSFYQQESGPPLPSSWQTHSRLVERTWQWNSHYIEKIEARLWKENLLWKLRNHLPFLCTNTFWRKLQGPANKVSDDVGVAHNDVNGIIHLAIVSTMNVLSKSSFYSSPVLVKSLRRRTPKCAADRWHRLTRCSLSNQIATKLQKMVKKKKKSSSLTS